MGSKSVASSILSQPATERKTGPARQARPSLQKGATTGTLAPGDTLSIMDEGDFVNARLTQLDHTIQRTARKIAYQTGTDPDEVAQEMYLAILEEARRKPDFLRQTDAYIITNLAQWRALDAIRRGVTWSKYNKEMPEVGDDDSAPVPLTDLVPAPSPTPEDALLADEESREREKATRRQVELVRAITPGLPERYQAVAHGLMNGHKKKDIAAALGVTPQNISQYLHKMRLIFEPALAPVGEP